MPSALEGWKKRAKWSGAFGELSLWSNLCQWVRIHLLVEFSAHKWQKTKTRRSCPCVSFSFFLFFVCVCAHGNFARWTLQENELSLHVPLNPRKRMFVFLCAFYFLLFFSCLHHLMYVFFISSFFFFSFSRSEIFVKGSEVLDLCAPTRPDLSSDSHLGSFEELSCTAKSRRLEWNRIY